MTHKDVLRTVFSRHLDQIPDRVEHDAVGGRQPVHTTGKESAVHVVPSTQYAHSPLAGEHPGRLSYGRVFRLRVEFRECKRGIFDAVVGDARGEAPHRFRVHTRSFAPRRFVHEGFLPRTAYDRDVASGVDSAMDVATESVLRTLCHQIQQPAGHLVRIQGVESGVARGGPHGVRVDDPRDCGTLATERVGAFPYEACSYVRSPTVRLDGSTRVARGPGYLLET